MAIHSIWPSFACMAILLLLASTPLLAAADSPPEKMGQSRNLPLDGLRGFLALGVFLHHAAITHHFLRDGHWGVPPSGFYTLIGKVGVALFFMITGYLFWSKMLHDRGQPDWFRLFLGRVFRIGPLFLLVTAGVLAGVWVATDGELRVPVLVLLLQVGTWLSLGLLRVSNINGYDQTGVLVAHVTWTLRYEWLFYLSLPLTALATRHPRWHLPAVALLFSVLTAYLAARTSPSESISTSGLLFTAGMLCASLQQRGLLSPINDRAASATAIAALVAVFALFDTVYLIGPILLLTVFFVLICNGCTLFGLLESHPARRLGNISYGIYLLQGFALVAVFWWPAAAAFQADNPARFWLLCLLCAVLLVLMATLAHVLIERPGIALGRVLARQLPRSGPPPSIPPPVTVIGRANRKQVLSAGGWNASSSSDQSMTILHRRSSPA